MDDYRSSFAKESNPPRAKELFAQTAQLLGRNGRLIYALISLLVCVIFFFAFAMAFHLVAELLNLFLLPKLSYDAAEACTTAFYVFAFLVFLLFVIPLFLGRWRYLGLLLQDSPMPPPLRELFYYYSSPHRLFRAFRLVLLLFLTAFAPIIGIYDLIDLSFMLYHEVFYVHFITPVAVVLLLACLFFVFALCVGWFFLSRLFALALGLAIGNESLGVFYCVRLSLGVGRRHYGTLLRFSLRSLLHLLLSIATLGIYYLLYFSHSYVLSYFRLTMALCPKGELQ